MSSITEILSAKLENLRVGSFFLSLILSKKLLVPIYKSDYLLFEAISFILEGARFKLREIILS